MMLAYPYLNPYFVVMKRLFEPVSWAHNTNIYEVNLRQYSIEGTFASFMKELPRLKDMGIRILWFMPVTPISVEKRLGTMGSYYACSSYTKTNPEYGSVEDFKLLVQKSHELGLKVIIDWVANHTGWDHEWTISNRGFYKHNDQGLFYDSNGWADVIDLNYYDGQMRAAMTDAMRFWVEECDIDGFRCDMAHLVPLDFWRNARLALDQIKPLFWLGETEDYNYQSVFDCSYAWAWMHRSEDFVKEHMSISELRALLEDYQHKKLPGSSHLFFTSNHDENSWNGTEYEKYGNAAITMAVLSASWGGTALVYSGQELPNNKRLKFFDKDPIEWTGKFGLHQFYKTLLEFRTSFGEQPTAMTVLGLRAGPQVFAFRKSTDQKEAVVLINLSNAQQKVHLEDDMLNGDYEDLFTGEKKEAPSIKDILMEPWSYLILEKT
jgi:alpha-amylase